MKVNSGQAPSTLIPEYIGTDFDKVIEVADNIEYVKDVAAGIKGLPVHGYIGETPPTQPKAGAEWYCTLDGRTYVWYVDDDSGQWVESSPQSTIETDPSIAHTVVTNTDNIFALWKHSAAEAGFNLVAGSFEEGGVLTSSTDVLWHKELDSIYSWAGTYPIGGYVVAPGTDPVVVAGYVPRTDVVLRDALLTGALRMRDGLFALRDIVSVADFGAVGGTTNDTVAFTDALSAGGGYAFVPYGGGVYTVDGDVEGLFGFGNIRFNGTGLVRYTNLAEYSGHKTAAYYGSVLARNEDFQASCFGDSTMYGYKVGMPLPTDEDVNNPPNILSVTLRALFAGSITVLNEAISGSNMRNMMRDMRFEGKIAPGGSSAGSDVIYCNHCINNVQSVYSVDEFKKDYVEFVRICRRYGKVPVIVTPNPIVPILGGDAIETRIIEAYVNAMRDVAKETGCDIVDNYAWAMKTASRVPLTEMVPDGIHPSSQLYLQNGRNLAIPLISAATLSSRGDVANIYSCSMRDTAASGISQQAGTLAGLNYTSTRNNSTETGIKFTVLFDEKIDYLALHALHWESGAKVKVRSHNHNTTAYWQTVDFFRQYGDANSLIWDTPFLVKSNGDSYAGLHVIECTYDLTDTDASNQMALNCVSLPNQFSQMMSKINSGGRYSLLTNALLTNQTMSLNFNFTLGGTGVLLADLSGYQALKIELTSGGAITATYAGTFGSATDTIVASGAVAGTKVVFVKVEPTQVTVNVDGVQVVRSISGWMPPLKLVNSGYTATVSNN